MLMMPLMVCWEYLWFERGLLRIDVVCVRGLDECLGGKFVDVTSDLKNSDVTVDMMPTVLMIVGVVDNPLGGNPTA